MFLNIQSQNRETFFHLNEAVLSKQEILGKYFKSYVKKENNGRKV